MSSNHLIIMAGGIGSRFWPVSTKECPKQFIDILGNGKTLIQDTVERFKDLCPINNIWVVTSKNYEKKVKEQIPCIPESNILLEPCRRNTAPCIAYAAWKIQLKDPNANMIVTPSDHHIINVTEFKRVVSSALEFVQNSNAILTIGIKPSRPDTGYGYIEAEHNTNQEIKKVKSFKEKPDLTTAKEYITKDNFFWNSGVFVWNVSTITTAISTYEPSIAAIFDGIKGFLGSLHEREVINAQFPNCNNISIDYAVLEKANNVYVYPSDFGWNDLGTWGSLYDFLEHDKDGNVSVASNAVMSETNNCIVHAQGNKEIILIGIEDCIIAEHEGKLLICNKAKEQSIKKLIE